MNAEEAKNLATHRLSVREYSAAEMTRYLVKKGSPSEIATSVVAELVEEKTIDDSRFAQVIIRHHLNRGKGSAYIRAKLHQKGVRIDLKIIQRLVGELGSESEFETARKMVERRYPDAGKDRKTAMKAIQALMRRGFSYETAKKAVIQKENKEE